MAATADAAPYDDEDVEIVPDADLDEPAYRDRDERRGAEDARPRVRVGIGAIRKAEREAPPITQVIEAAYRAAGLADDPVAGWRWRTRASGLLPVFSMRIGQNDSWAEIADPTIRRGTAVDFRLQWRVDRLLFDGNELRIAAADVSRRRERRRLSAEAVHLYYRWIRARAGGLADDEVTAELDAMTDGWFSQALVKYVERR